MMKRRVSFDFQDTRALERYCGKGRIRSGRRSNARCVNILHFNPNANNTHQNKIYLKRSVKGEEKSFLCMSKVKVIRKKGKQYI